MNISPRKILSTFLALLLIFAVLPPLSLAQNKNVDFSSDEVVIKFKPGVSAEATSSLHRLIGAEKKSEIKQLRTHLVKLPAGLSVAEAVARYSRNPNVEFAEPNYVRSILAVPNDLLYNTQWAPSKISAEQAWDITTGEANTTIAIVDTGVDYNHEDLAGKVIKGYDFYNGDSDPIDDHGHGTMVAGVAAAVTNNSKGIAGISWGSNILAVKVMNSAGVGYSYQIAYGMVYAADQGAKVINLSLGGTTVATVEFDAVSYARSKGAVIAAAVGNDGTNVALYPAAISGVIGVGSTDKTDKRSTFSNYGSSVDVTAPGEDIRSTTLGGSYGLASGTSLATPHVAGLAALVASRYPTMSNDEIASQIQGTALDLGTTGRDDYFGYGRIEAYQALSIEYRRYEETNPSIAYTGTWGTYTNSNTSGGTQKYTKTAGSSATLTFSGTSVTWIISKNYNYGIAKVYIDGAFDANVDLYNSASIFQQSVYTKSALSSGTHTITIEHSGTKNPSSSDYYIGVDAFDVRQSAEANAPAAPAGLSASAVSGAVNLSWTANTEPDLAGYKVYYGSAPGVYGGSLDVGNQTSYRLDGLANGTTYYMTVSAYDARRNESTKSAEISATPTEDGVPAMPSGLSVSPLYLALDLSWTANADPDLAGYRIYYGTASGVYGTPIDAGKVTSYRLSGILGGTSHYLAISAYDSNGNESAKSSEVMATPMDVRKEESSTSIVYTDTWNTVSDVKASGGAFKWTYILGRWPSAELAFTGTAVSWISYKGPDSGIARVYIDDVQQADVDLYNNVPLYQQRVFSKTGLSPGQHKIKVVEIGTKTFPSSDYRVSVDSFDFLSYADTVAPSAPSLGATAVSESSINLTWTAATDDVGVTGYRVERSPDGITGWAEIGTTSSLSYSDSGLTPNVTYYYRIRAYDAAGNNSVYSNIASATTLASTTRFEETSSSITYSGTWGTYTNASTSGGTQKYTKTTGSTATFAFTGTAVTWIISKNNNYGIAKVYIDGVFDANVDLYNTTNVFQQPVYTKSALLSATHTITIEHSGTKNPSSSDYYIGVDAFDVFTTPAPPDTTAPSAPTALSATAVSSSAINLSWAASSDDVGVSGYRIERGTDGISFTEVGTTSSLSYPDTGLSASITYYYRVRAYDAAANNSSYSTTASATTLSSPPTRYEDTSAAITYSGTWGTYVNANTSGGTQKYTKTAGSSATFTFTGTSVTWIISKNYNYGIAKVYIDGVFDANVDLYNSTSVFQQAVYTKSALSSGTHTITIEHSGTKNPASSDYYIGVDAFDVANVVSSDTEAPSAPLGLSATPASLSRIDLSWSASSDNVGVAGYKIERSTDGLSFAQVASVSSTTFSDTGLASGTTYYYHVRAYDAAGNNSSYSNTASAKTYTRFEETSPSITYSGTWGTYVNANTSGGTQKYTKTAGSSATFTFTGTSVTWIISKNYNYGIAKVYIDGVFDANVDLYNSTSVFQQAVYTKSALLSATHTITIEHSGTKNPSSSDYYIGVDAFDVR